VTSPQIFTVISPSSLGTPSESPQDNNSVSPFNLKTRGNRTSPISTSLMPIIFNPMTGMNMNAVNHQPIDIDIGETVSKLSDTDSSISTMKSNIAQLHSSFKSLFPNYQIKPKNRLMSRINKRKHSCKFYRSSRVTTPPYHLKRLTTHK
jgi:hypothetical protein